jgi:DNA-binding NarL/FixJ family response regulator
MIRFLNQEVDDMAPDNEMRCVCVEDHAIVGNWLERCLDDAGFTLAARIADPARLLATVDGTGAQIVISDVMLPLGDPFGTVEDLRLRRPAVRVMFLSSSTSIGHLQSALRARASGYFGKADAPESIVEGVRAVGHDRFAFGASVIEAWPALRQHDGAPARWPLEIDFDNSTPLASLTTREMEVLRLMAQGMQRSAIAETLHRSPKTVDKHRASIMRKLDIHDRAEIVLYAVREGLVAAT